MPMDLVPTSPCATIFEMFRQVAERRGDAAWLCVPPSANRGYAPGGEEVTYREGLKRVLALQHAYRRGGYGIGHRVALMLDNRPEHFVHMWALNGLGVSVVPLSGDSTASELAYVLEHSDVHLIAALGRHRAKLESAASFARRDPPVVEVDSEIETIPPASRAAGSEQPTRRSEAAVIYTSGTTGHPKGCLIDNQYMFTVAEWYASTGGRLELREGEERVYVPLPVFHVNAGINTPAALILTGNCMITPDRFHARSFWSDAVTTRATAMHYLGIMPPVLLAAPSCREEREHSLRFGLGAGIDPQIHRRFENRFRVPMVEVWGMTETGRFLADADEPRQVGSRAIGRPSRGLMARIVDEADREMPRGAAGELVVRLEGDDPRAGFFRGYLKDDLATETAWRNDWFHTGDVAVQAADGMLYFVERRKNIIRRSGENIAATEVEDALIACPLVRDAAVLPIQDDIQGEEVLACIVLNESTSDDSATARAILAHVADTLAENKRPGWMVFVPSVPRTGTHKARKNLIFPDGEDPRSHPRALDLRSLKRRQHNVRAVLAE